MTADKLWVCGTVGKAHGLHGEAYLELAPHGVEYLNGGERFLLTRDDGLMAPCGVTRAGGTDLRPLIRLDCAATRDELLTFQGATVLAAGGALDELPSYRVGDLIGLAVLEEPSHPVGTVVDVLSGPVQEILSVETPGGDTVLVPLVDELVTVDLDEGVVKLREGLLE
jgi:16S rRNA processing protein RimM